jgi:hypothetical protein
MEVSGQVHAPAALPREGAPGNHCVGGFLGPRTGLDTGEEKNIFLLLGIEPRHPKFY